MRTLAVALEKTNDNRIHEEGEDNSVGVSEHFYRDKLRHLTRQLDELYQFRHPEYVVGLKKLTERMRGRLDYRELFKEVQIKRIGREYEAEKVAVVHELQERKNDLLESLQNELDEKKKQIEYEYNSMDLAGSSHNFYPGNKKSLRRRPNEPPSLNEKRQRKSSPQQIVYHLNDNDISDDLKMIGSNCRLKNDGNSSKDDNLQTAVERRVICNGDSNVSIEGSKLFYDGKCYLRGQAVHLEATDIGKMPAIIQTINQNDIFLKSVGENKRILVTIDELEHGRVAIRKRMTQ